MTLALQGPQKNIGIYAPLELLSLERFVDTLISLREEMRAEARSKAN